MSEEILNAEAFISDFDKYKNRVIFAHDINVDSMEKNILGFQNFEIIKLSHRSLFGIYGTKEIVKLIREFDANQIERKERMFNRKIMIDLKLHDIPSSNAEMAKSIVNYLGGVDFLTIHASGGSEMMSTCVKGVSNC